MQQQFGRGSTQHCSASACPRMLPPPEHRRAPCGPSVHAQQLLCLVPPRLPTRTPFTWEPSTGACAAMPTTS